MSKIVLAAALLVAFASSAFAETVIIKHGHPHPHFHPHPHKVVIIKHH